jgi:hypothetical protein
MSMDKPEESQKTVSARRRLFQIFAVGGVASVVLPEKWVKPVIDAVIVPAHAAGSVGRQSGIFGNAPVPIADSGHGNFLERLAGVLIGSAYAGPVLPSCGLTASNNACISFNIAPYPSSSVDVTIVDYRSPAQGSVTTTIYPNNSINNVTLLGYSFTNLVVDSVNLNGRVGTPNCAIEAFTFPRVAGVCLVVT